MSSRCGDVVRLVNPISSFYRSATPTGIKILLTSLVLGTLSALPLWLAARFGPEDSGATGVALVAMFGTIAGALGTAIGLLWLAIEWLARRR